MTESMEQKKRPVKKVNLRPMTTEKDPRDNKERRSIPAKKTVIRGAPIRSKKRILLEKIHPIQKSQFSSEPALDTDALQEVTYVAEYEQEKESLAEYKAKELKRVRDELQALKEETLRSTQEEVNAIKEAARSEGFEQGYKDGIENLKSAASEFFTGLNDVAEAKKDMVAQAEPELVKLSLAIAEKVVGQAIELDETLIKSIILEAIQKITDKDKVIIRASENEVAAIRQIQDDIRKHMPEIKQLVIQVDHRLKSGGVIIETQLGYIDASVKTKLDTIEKAFGKTGNV